MLDVVLDEDFSHRFIIIVEFHLDHDVQRRADDDEYFINVTVSSPLSSMIKAMAFPLLSASLHE